MSEFDKQARWLAGCGIAVPAYRIVATLEEARLAARALRYPLVVKPVPEAAAHKTELGLVHLRLRDEAALETAVRDIQATLPDAPLLVQEMVDDVVEVLLAVREDADFGPIAAIGTGGTMVELQDDITYLSLPATPGQFRRALEGLRVARVLAGYRGQAPRDIDALVDAASRLGKAYLEARDSLAEFEINPLAVRAAGRGVVALDVLGVARHPSPAVPGDPSS